MRAVPLIAVLDAFAWRYDNTAIRMDRRRFGGAIIIDQTVVVIVNDGIICVICAVAIDMIIARCCLTIGWLLDFRSLVVVMNAHFASVLVDMNVNVVLVVCHYIYRTIDDRHGVHDVLVAITIATATGAVAAATTATTST